MRASGWGRNASTALLLAIAATCQAAVLRVVGVANASEPAFTALVDVPTPGGGQSCLISRFTGNPLAPDGLDLVPSIGMDFRGDFGKLKVATVLNNITWPNTVQPADPTLAGPGALLVSGGFLVPPKSVGAVHVVRIDDASGTPDVAVMAKITTDKGNPLFNGWFYHEAHSGEAGCWHSPVNLLPALTTALALSCLSRDRARIAMRLLNRPWPWRILCLLFAHRRCRS